MTVTEQTQWRAGGVTVHRTGRVADDQVEPLWQQYRRAFEPLREAAAARQVLHRSEYVAELADDRIDKYVAVDDDGLAIGQAAVTNRLDLIEWISPDYYRARYPERARRGAIFYVSFACTDAERRHPGVLWALVQAFTEKVVAVDGVLAYDTCALNDDSIRFSRTLNVWFRRLGAPTVGQVDTQNYYVAEYGKDAQ